MQPLGDTKQQPARTVEGVEQPGAQALGFEIAGDEVKKVRWDDQLWRASARRTKEGRERL